MQRILVALFIAAGICHTALAQTNANTGCANSPTICNPTSFDVSSTSNAFIFYVPGTYNSVSFQLTGLTAAGATLTPKIAVDTGAGNNAAGATYAALPSGAFVNASGASVAAAFADGRYTLTIPPSRWVEMAVTSAGTGTATISYTMAVAPPAGSVGGGGSSPSNPSYVTQAPTTNTTTYSNQTGAIGTTSTGITINSLSFSSANWKFAIFTNQSGCDVWINRTGGTAVARQGIEIPNGGGYLFGYASGYGVPTNAATGIAVNPGTTTACTGGSVNLAVDAG